MSTINVVMSWSFKKFGSWEPKKIKARFTVLT